MIEVERLIETLPPPSSGLHAKLLLQIAADVGVLQWMGENETQTMVVDYTAPNAEHIKIVTGDSLLTPVEPFVVTPVRITYSLEEHMFGGDTYFTLTADGHALFRPLRWDSYEMLTHHELSVK